MTHDEAIRTRYTGRIGDRYYWRGRQWVGPPTLIGCRRERRRPSWVRSAGSREVHCG